jgi:hypothetical protein
VERITQIKVTVPSNILSNNAYDLDPSKVSYFLSFIKYFNKRVILKKKHIFIQQLYHNVDMIVS